MRIDGREQKDLRPIRILSGVNPYAEGSVEVSFGTTKVLVTASIEKAVPPWMKEGMGGWITAEYGMLPRSTHQRNRREASTGKQGGRTLEIQRLIGRALRAAVDLKLLEGLTVQLDCDVMVADGGTRTAAISGGWVALAHAFAWAEKESLVTGPLPLRQVAAVSLGVVSGATLLDLCYEEDSQADFDLNLVMNDAQEIIEIQGTGERASVSQAELGRLLALGTAGINKIMEEQRKVLPNR